MGGLPAPGRWLGAGGGRCVGLAWIARPGVEMSLDAARMSACATWPGGRRLDGAYPVTPVSLRCLFLLTMRCAPVSAPAFPAPAWVECRARLALLWAWRLRRGATRLLQARPWDANSIPSAAASTMCRGLASGPAGG